MRPCPRSVALMVCGVPRAGGVTARLLAGSLDGAAGPFRTVQPIMMVDVALPAGARFEHEVPRGLDNAMAFVHKVRARCTERGRDLYVPYGTPHPRVRAGQGVATVNGEAVPMHQIAMLDARDATGGRGCALVAGPAGASVMLFAGKRLEQPIAWHGPFVMTTQAEIRVRVCCRTPISP